MPEEAVATQSTETKVSTDTPGAIKVDPNNSMEMARLIQKKNEEMEQAIKPKENLTPDDLIKDHSTPIETKKEETATASGVTLESIPENQRQFYDKQEDGSYQFNRDRLISDHQNLTQQFQQKKDVPAADDPRLAMAKETSEYFKSQRLEKENKAQAADQTERIKALADTIRKQTEAGEMDASEAMAKGFYTLYAEHQKDLEKIKAETKAEFAQNEVTKRGNENYRDMCKVEGFEGNWPKFLGWCKSTFGANWNQSTASNMLADIATFKNMYGLYETQNGGKGELKTIQERSEIKGAQKLRQAAPGSSTSKSPESEEKPKLDPIMMRFMKPGAERWRKNVSSILQGQK